MKRAIILHGVCDADEYFKMDFPSPSNAHWIPWLQQKFLRSGILCQTPEMPKPFEPVYSEWTATFEQMTLAGDALVVAHSAGCGFILKWLMHHPQQKLKRLVLVAPWLDPQRTCGNFLTCDLKRDLQDRVGDIHVLYSENEDTEGVCETKDLIMATYPNTVLHRFADKGHFCLGDLGTAEFPDLWDICCA